MNFSATLDGSIATITLNQINNTSNLKVEGATNLGDQLLAFVADPNETPFDAASYCIDPTDSGIRITNATGHIDLPWRWITPVANALNA